MFKDLNNLVGFRNLDPDCGQISKVMESRCLFDYENSTASGIVALLVTNGDYTDESIVKRAEMLPEGQKLWAFSSQFRVIDHPRLKVTHVRSENEREFLLKTSHHIGKLLLQLPQGSPLSPERREFPTTNRVVRHDEPYVPLLDKRAIVTRENDGVPYEFFSDLRSDSRKLVVFGQSAVTRGKTPLPYFFRWTWAHRIAASVMIWNDPTLYVRDDLDAGWWIGTRERDYVSEAMEIIRANLRALDLSSSDVIFVGLSAGGMSALPMGSLLPGSHVIVENPRVTMFADGAKGGSAKKAIQACLGEESPEDVPKELQYRIDAMARIKREGHLPSFTYLQNMLDEHHAEPHYLRFRNEVECHSQFNPLHHRFVEYAQWSLLRGGHFPLKEAAMLRIINQIVEGDTSFPEKLTKKEITRD